MSTATASPVILTFEMSREECFQHALKGRVSQEAYLEHMADRERRAASAAAAKQAGPLTIKVSAEKRVVCVYGLQRRPVSLYARQWLRLMDADFVAKIRQFCEEGLKNGTCADKQAD